MTNKRSDVINGLAGKRVAEMVDHSTDDSYWRDNFHQRSYIARGVLYIEYQPAYRYGAESVCNYPEKTFDEVEAKLARGWNKRCQGKSSLTWSWAKDAVRDAWNRAVGK